MGEWSPICRACWWDEGGGPQVGAWFTGRNETPGTDVGDTKPGGGRRPRSEVRVAGQQRLGALGVHLRARGRRHPAHRDRGSSCPQASRVSASATAQRPMRRSSSGAMPPGVASPPRSPRSRRPPKPVNSKRSDEPAAGGWLAVECSGLRCRPELRSTILAPATCKYARLGCARRGKIMQRQAADPAAHVFTLESNKQY